MEYLMTYGWAIMVIVIVLAALLYLGVFSMGERTPDLCQFQVGFLCTGFKATTSSLGALSMTLTNGLPSTIYLCNVVCDDTLTSPPIMSACIGADAAASLKTGQSATVYFPDSTPCTDSSAQQSDMGERYIGKIYLLYNEEGDSGSGNARIAVGNIITTIQP